MSIPVVACGKRECKMKLTGEDIYKASIESLEIQHRMIDESLWHVATWETIPTVIRENFKIVADILNNKTVIFSQEMLFRSLCEDNPAHFQTQVMGKFPITRLCENCKYYLDHKCDNRAVPNTYDVYVPPLNTCNFHEWNVKVFPKGETKMDEHVKIQESKLDPFPKLTGKDIHAKWLQGMQEQDRSVAPSRLFWETLSWEDQALDENIAKMLNEVLFDRTTAYNNVVCAARGTHV
jgi:hypothetical protein